MPALTHAHAFSLQQLHQGRSPSPLPQPDRKEGDDDDDDNDDNDRGNDQSNNVDYTTQTGNPYFPVPGTAITMTSSLSFFNPTPSIPITTAPTGTSAPFLVFEDIQNTTVCGENAISWEYAGDQDFTLALAVTNKGVDGVDPSAQPITMILEVDTDGLNTSNTYQWSPVKLPMGAYVAAISIPEPDMLYISPTFYVFNSSDHSCLSSSPSTTTSLTGSSTTATMSPSQTNTGTALPVEGAVSKGLSGGSIAGIVIGILALVGLVGALLVLLRRCRSRTAASSALFGRSRRMSGYIEKRDPPSPGLGAAGGIGGFPVRSRGRSGGVSGGGAVTGAGVSRGFGGGSSDFAVHNVHGSSSQEEVASLADQEKAVENARPSTFASDADVLGVLSLHSFPPNSYRDSSASGPVPQGGVVGGPSRSSSYSARSVASDPFDSDGGVIPRSSPPMPSSRLSLAPSDSDPFNPFASPADLEQNRAQVGSRERQVPVQLFMPTSATSSPRPGIPRDISTSSMAESDADTYTYEQEADHLSEGATTATAGTMVPPPRRIPPSAPAMSAGRRTMSSRKPVPVYAPSVSGEALELTEPATPRSAYYQHSSYSTHSGSGNSGNDWSSAAAHSHSPATASPMSSGSHLPHGANNWKRDSTSLSISGSTTSASRSVSVIGGASTISPSSPTTLGSPSTVVNGHASFLSGHQYLPELNHKSSFGDRPVHYLIPDPPSENVL